MAPIPDPMCGNLEDCSAMQIKVLTEIRDAVKDLQPSTSRTVFETGSMCFTAGVSAYWLYQNRSKVLQPATRFGNYVSEVWRKRVDRVSQYSQPGSSRDGSSHQATDSPNLGGNRGKITDHFELVDRKNSSWKFPGSAMRYSPHREFKDE